MVRELKHKEDCFGGSGLGETKPLTVSFFIVSTLLSKEVKIVRLNVEFLHLLSYVLLLFYVVKNSTDIFVSFL